MLKTLTMKSRESAQEINMLSFTLGPVTLIILMIVAASYIGSVVGGHFGFKRGVNRGTSVGIELYEHMLGHALGDSPELTKEVRDRATAYLAVPENQAHIFGGGSH
jgi:hypothetical protein